MYARRSVRVQMHKLEAEVRAQPNASKEARLKAFGFVLFLYREYHGAALVERLTHMHELTGRALREAPTHSDEYTRALGWESAFYSALFRGNIH